MRASALHLAPALVLIATIGMSCYGGERNSQDSSTVAIPASATPSDAEFPPGVEDNPVRSRPAASDEFGRWEAFEIHGVTAEVPFDDAAWRIQIILDPCYGDGRYFLLLEERATGDRIRVDLANRKVANTSANPDRLNPITERIVRSISGTHDEPSSIKTFGPQPTMPWCNPDPDSVPTLTPDEFTPRPSRTGVASEFPATPADGAERNVPSLGPAMRRMRHESSGTASAASFGSVRVASGLSHRCRSAELDCPSFSDLRRSQTRGSAPRCPLQLLLLGGVGVLAVDFGQCDRLRYGSEQRDVGSGGRVECNWPRVAHDGARWEL